jgi:glycosyltransferase involved in cell wall biosynthesis
MNLLLFNLKCDADDDVLGFTTEWINALARHCDKVVVVTMTAGRIAVSDNVRVFSVGREHGYSEARRAWNFYKLVLRIVREERIDACFAHMMPLFAVMAWPILRPRRIPILLWYAHGHIPFIVLVAERLVDRVLASTASGFRLASSKLRLIGQGIDTDRFVPREAPRDAGDGDFRLITVGRLSRIKRLDVAIDALERATSMSDDGQRLTYVLVGSPLTAADREYEQEIRSLARSTSVADRVEFLGPTSFATVHQLYREAEICVNTSDTGSADKAVLEAMSAALPVLTSNEAFVQLLPVGLHAECLVPRADPVILARRISQLAALTGSQRRELGLRLRSVVVESHSLRQLSARIIAEARALIAARAEV